MTQQDDAVTPQPDPEFDRAFNRQLNLGVVAGVPVIGGLIVLLFTDLAAVGWSLIGVGVVATIAVELRTIPWWRSPDVRYRRLALMTLFNVAVVAFVVILAFTAPRP